MSALAVTNDRTLFKSIRQFLPFEVSERPGRANALRAVLVFTPGFWQAEGLMSRRRFLKTVALMGAGAMAGGLGSQRRASAQQTAAAGVTRRPTRIVLAGYGPSSTGFSLALKRIGDRLAARFGNEVDVKYVYNVLDLGYREDDLNWMVEDGVLTLAYQSSGYFTNQVPDLGVNDLPFVFPDVEAARAAIDGRFGEALSARLEARMNCRVLGYFEAGFSRLSNALRPVHTPADMKGMRVRVRPSKVHARIFELLGAEPKPMDLSEFIEAVKAGTVDAQENPFPNTVTYGVHKFHRFHTVTNQHYQSRQVFVNKPAFDAWPRSLQEEMRAAVKDAVAFQRELHLKESDDAMAAIRSERGEIVELTAQEHQAFVRALRPIHNEARNEYGRDLLGLVGL
jgi:tripartite ATP-independent transporter DctP family solute receptor